MVKSILDLKLARNIKSVNYSQIKQIKGVKLISLKHYSSESGLFLEIGRLKKDGSFQDLPEFTLNQLSFSIVEPHTVKAWHIHLDQDDVWFIPPNSRLLVGLYDVRKNSPTKGLTMRFFLGNFSSNILFIPKGIAHGSCNLTNSQVNVFYLSNKHFQKIDPDEKRLSWDIMGADFWSYKKD